MTLRELKQRADARAIKRRMVDGGLNLLRICAGWFALRLDPRRFMEGL